MGLQNSNRNTSHWHRQYAPNEPKITIPACQVHVIPPPYNNPKIPPTDSLSRPALPRSWRRLAQSVIHHPHCLQQPPPLECRGLVTACSATACALAEPRACPSPVARRPSPGRRPPPPRLRGRRPAAGGLSTRGSSLVPATARCSATGRPHCGLRSAGAPSSSRPPPLNHSARQAPRLLRSRGDPSSPPRPAT